MATLEQATTYNTARQNEEWSELEPEQARALLQDAEDYIRTVYPIRSNLDVDEQRIFDSVVCRLASLFQFKPPAVADSPAIKKESKEGVGFKKSVEYADGGTDPYPYVTAVLRPFLRTANPSVAFQIARLVR